MLSLKYWHGPPHLCKCFYHKETKIFTLNAMTDRGYTKLIEVLNRIGYKFPEKPEIRVTPAMLTIAPKVLKQEINLHPQERLFSEEPSPRVKEEMEKMNVFLKKLMDAENSGMDYDLRELAFLSGIEFETAKQIVEQIEKKFKRR